LNGLQLSGAASALHRIQSADINRDCGHCPHAGSADRPLSGNLQNVSFFDGCRTIAGRQCETSMVISPANRSQPLKVGEVARRSGVPISTIHFYEKRGLIGAARTRGNQRLYPRSVLRRVAVIRIAQRAGIPLSIVKEHLDQMPLDRVPTAQDWRYLTNAWRELLNERIECLRHLRDQLGHCIGCGCLSLTDCPIRNPDDRLGREGAGARLLLRCHETSRGDARRDSLFDIED
jgi:MerR family transcriptional regulator, redox-sensitive transcriptional activator SoxR